MFAFNEQIKKTFKPMILRSNDVFFGFRADCCHRFSRFSIKTTNYSNLILLSFSHQFLCVSDKWFKSKVHENQTVFSSQSRSLKIIYFSIFFFHVVKEMKVSQKSFVFNSLLFQRILSLFPFFLSMIRAMNVRNFR